MATALTRDGKHTILYRDPDVRWPSGFLGNRFWNLGAFPPWGGSVSVVALLDFDSDGSAASWAAYISGCSPESESMACMHTAKRGAHLDEDAALGLFKGRDWVGKLPYRK